MKRPLHDRMSRSLLESLLDERVDSLAHWNPSDLAAILTHQLDTPLAREAQQLAVSGGRTEAAVAEMIGPADGTTFGDVLLGDRPTEAQVLLVKDYAKHAVARATDIPEETARVMYVLAILRGTAGGFRQVTALDASAMEREARRCLTYAWLPAPVAAALQTLVRSLFT